MVNYIRNKKGFTLVEIIVVLVIIAILAATTLPALTGYIDDARNKTAISEGRTVLVAAQTIASQMKGDGKVNTDIETQIKKAVHVANSKYPSVNSLTGMNLSDTDITAVSVDDGTGAVEGFTVKASNGKYAKYASKSFTVVGKSGD